MHLQALVMKLTYLQALVMKPTSKGFVCVMYIINIVRYIIKCIFITYLDIFVSVHWCPSYSPFPFELILVIIFVIVLEYKISTHSQTHTHTHTHTNTYTKTNTHTHTCSPAQEKSVRHG